MTGFPPLSRQTGRDGQGWHCPTQCPTAARHAAGTTMSTTDAIQRLQDAPAGTRVRLHYRSSYGEKTKIGTKTGSGGPITAATIDTDEELDDGTPRIIEVDNGGQVRSQGKVQTQRIGQLSDVDLPDDNRDDCVRIVLEDEDEIDWLKEGRENGGEA